MILQHYVATTRCDMSNGFLVFTAKHSGLEIWRRATDVRSTILHRRGQIVHTPIIAPATAAIRDFQVQAGALAPVATDSDRGHFVPHAYIDTSRDIGAVRLFRVSYPLLAYTGFAQTNDVDVSIVDITSGETIWRVAIGPGRVLGRASHFHPYRTASGWTST